LERCDLQLLNKNPPPFGLIALFVHLPNPEATTSLYRSENDRRRQTIRFHARSETAPDTTDLLFGIRLRRNGIRVQCAPAVWCDIRRCATTVVRPFDTEDLWYALKRRIKTTKAVVAAGKKIENRVAQSCPVATKSILGTI
jgi:hypothetical protein